MLINLNGNVVNRFGNRFPVPFMEKINVNNGFIDIDVSFYFMKDNADEGDILWTEYVNSLSDLQYSIVMVPDFVAGTSGHDPYGLSAEELLEKYGPIEYNNTSTSLFSRLQAGTLNILDIVVSNEQRTYGFEELLNFGYGSVYDREQRIYYKESSYFWKLNQSYVLFVNSLNLNESGEWNSETHYDAEQNEIVKYSKTLRIESNVGEYDRHMEMLIQALRSGLETHLVAFTTSLDNNVYPNGFTDEQKQNIRSKNGPANILFSQISDLSFEQISKNSQIKSSNVEAYRTAAGDLYDGDVLQSIDGLYYGSSQVTNQEIIATFSDLVVSTNDEDVQQKIDSLAYILAAHGNDVNILRRLNDYRKTFIETSTATAVGRMHETFEIRLYNANNAVKKGSILTKTLNLSPVVVDSTTDISPSGPDSLSFPELFTPEYSNNFIYTRSAKLGAYALPSGDATSREDAIFAAESFRVLSDNAKELRDEQLEMADEYYGKTVAEIAKQIIAAYIGLVNFFDYGRDLPAENITRLTLSTASDTDNLFIINSGLAESIPGFNNNVFVKKLAADERFTDIGDIDAGYALLGELLSYFQAPGFNFYDADILNEIKDSLEAAEVGKEGSTDAEIFGVIEAAREWYISYAAEDRDTDFVVGIGEFIRSWLKNESQTKSLEMFELDINRDLSETVGTRAGAIQGLGLEGQDIIQETEATVATVLGEAKIAIPYIVYPMLRRSQLSPEIISTGEEEGDALGTVFLELYEDLGRGLSGESTGYDEYDISQWTDAIKTYRDTGNFDSGVAQSGRGMFLLPGASMIFESEQLIDFTDSNAVQKYTDALNYFYSYNKEASPMGVMNPDTTPGNPAYFRKQRFAAACNLLEIGLAPLCYLKANYNADEETSYGVDNGLAAAHYSTFVGHYQQYLQYQKQYYLYEKAAEAYENLALAMSEDDVEKIFSEYNYYLNGYVFFDYEKAWHTTSNISKILSTKRIESIFGRAFCHTFFSLENARAEKLFDEGVYDFGETTSLPDEDYVPPEDNYPDNINSRGYIDSSFKDNMHIAAVPVTAKGLLVQPTYISSPNIAEYAGTPFGRDSTMSQEQAGDLAGGVEQRSPSGLDVERIEYPTFITRAFKLIGENANNSYRLVCFELQDVDGSYSAIPEEFDSGDNRDGNYETILVPNGPRNSLLFTVTMSDRTADLLNVLIEQYYNTVYNDYEFYYQAAIEECSFNNNTDKLNEFFINSIIENYSEDPHLAPWFKTCFIYNLHLDLLSNAYNGNIDEIKVAAINDTHKISPLNATLADLESYRNKLRDLYEEFYSPNGGTILSLMNELSLESNNKVVFGGHPSRGGIEAVAGHAAIVTDIPTPANIDPYAYAGGTGGGFVIRSETIDDIT